MKKKEEKKKKKISQPTLNRELSWVVEEEEEEEQEEEHLPYNKRLLDWAQHIESSLSHFGHNCWANSEPGKWHHFGQLFFYGFAKQVVLEVVVACCCRR